jgi:simple sugar transport system ATP-binding protein
VELDLGTKVWQLPVGQQQWIEILKALYVGARLLILDEPTAVLTPQESRALFEILRMMTRKNMSVILISHKLNEVLQSDRVTILRKGKKVATVKTAETTREELTAMMIGREVDVSLTKDAAAMGPEILAIQNLRARDDRGREALRGIDLVVRGGEIVGIAGVAGNGQKELFETLIGVRKARSGQVTLMGEDITRQSPKYIQEKGVAFIPEDRFAEGLVPDFSVEENLILGNQRAARFKSRGFIDFARVADFAKKCIARYEIATPSGKTLTRTLSGGNAQKLIVAREFAKEAKLTLANQPSRGLDVGVIEYMHHALLAKRREGGAILLASEDLDELYNIADTIVVIHKGRIMGSFPVAEADIQQIGLLMVGSGTDEFGLACRV